MKKRFLWSACILCAIFLAATLIGPSIILHAVRQPDVAESYAYSTSFSNSYEEHLKFLASLKGA